VLNAIYERIGQRDDFLHSWGLIGKRLTNGDPEPDDVFALSFYASRRTCWRGSAAPILEAA
jgi:hypothetical protein